jgi:K+/H+ antiporter YhaU regulatory subunit KhtT
MNAIEKQIIEEIQELEAQLAEYKAEREAAPESEKTDHDWRIQSKKDDIEHHKSLLSIEDSEIKKSDLPKIANAIREISGESSNIDDIDIKEIHLSLTDKGLAKSTAESVVAVITQSNSINPSVSKILQEIATLAQ